MRKNRGERKRKTLPDSYHRLGSACWKKGRRDEEAGEKQVDHEKEWEK